MVLTIRNKELNTYLQVEISDNNTIVEVFDLCKKFFEEYNYMPHTISIDGKYRFAHTLSK